jgi:hypothetical protein
MNVPGEMKIGVLTEQPQSFIRHLRRQLSAAFVRAVAAGA